jgi:hypothetical protein
MKSTYVTQKMLSLVLSAIIVMLVSTSLFANNKIKENKVQGLNTLKGIQ